MWEKQFPEGDTRLVGNDPHPRKKVFLNTSFDSDEPMSLFIRNDRGKYLLLVFMNLAGIIVFICVLLNLLTLRISVVV